MTLDELKEKYQVIPQELKNLRRWVCYDIIVDKETGKARKMPVSAFGGPASSTNPNTWCNFNAALLACARNEYAGIGFNLGKVDENTCYFGVDIDNHPDEQTGEKMSQEEFNKIANEFVSSLDSYSEYSHSGEGVHIICKGTLPVGARRKAGCCIEMYDSGRFFTMTGKVIKDASIQERTEQIKTLWEKYLNVKDENTNYINRTRTGYIHMDENGVMHLDGPRYNSVEIGGSALSDSEVIEKASSATNGADFVSLFNGNYGKDHSAADMSLCNHLAFWTNCNAEQMDRIFRSSKLMRDKWDEMHGKETYGERTIRIAIESQHNTYIPVKKTVFVESHIVETKSSNVTFDIKKQIDEKGDPIVNFKKVFKRYPLTDTGNAERFYDQFGEYFKYNKTGKYWMYWTGKKWIVDEKEYIKKYSDKLIEIMRTEADAMDQEIEDAVKSGATEESIKQLMTVQNALYKNIDRISNKAGKEAMLSELEHLHDIPTIASEYDTHGYLLNTDSGIVNLETGQIQPFDRGLLMSKSTNCEVSYETPETWIKFLHDIFKRDNEQETEEIVDCIQKAIGYCLTDSVKEQCMFILHGDGSNGKSTFIEELCRMLGDYGVTGDTDILVQSKNASGQSTQFSLAGYKGTRLISVSETDEGSKLAEARIKAMTGNAEIRAQEKFGKPFTYAVTYKIWLATNPKPIIRGTDLGIWRRVFYFPFERKFTDNEKDITMPDKLRAETPKILGWAIEGYKKYVKEGLKKPKCIEEATSSYRNEMDVINAWISNRCTPFSGYETKASTLFENYKAWAKDDCEWLMSNTKFGQELMKKGYKKVRRCDGFYYVGLKLLDDYRGISFKKDNFMLTEDEDLL